MNAFFALLLALSLIPQAGTNEIWIRWSYPFNNSTYRHYRVENAHIMYVGELGPDGFIEHNNPCQPYDTRCVPTTNLVLYGRADTGDMHILPTHGSCWLVTMVSDYSTLKQTWPASDDTNVTCYTQRLANIIHQ